MRQAIENPRWVFVHRLIFIFIAIACFAPFVSGSLALVAGVLLGIGLGNPFTLASRQISKYLLMASVVGLGAGTHLAVITQVGLRGVGYTVIGITLTLTLGLFLGKGLKMSPGIALLVSVGTAICGGSAIAAVAPVCRAKPHDITVAMAIVFVLNGVALLLFPWAGHLIGLSQRSFGLWSALAIHDTSSVVGAGLAYGNEALAIGTTVKLARALWIAPVAILIAYLTHRNNPEGESRGKITFPWFILGFLFFAAIFSYFPVLEPAGQVLASVSKRMLVITLFFIGSQISLQSLKEVEFAPLVQGVTLWAIVAVTTLKAILLGWIKI